MSFDVKKSVLDEGPDDMKYTATSKYKKKVPTHVNQEKEATNVGKQKSNHSKDEPWNNQVRFVQAYSNYSENVTALKHKEPNDFSHDFNET